MKEIMRICEEALEKAGYETCGCSAGCQRFIVRVGDVDVFVAFEDC